MSNVTINNLPTYVGLVDPVNDLIPIYQNSSQGTYSINRNSLLALSSTPVGISDTQTLTNKTITSPTISGPTLSGTIGGTYTIGGTPTFPSSVVTLTGTQTLTNKTLTSPTINSPTITNATINADIYAGYTTSNTGTIYGISVSSGAISSNLSLTGTVSITGLITGAGGLTISGGTTQLLPTLKNPYKFSAYIAAATLSVTSNASSIVTCDTKRFDTGTNYSTSTGLFTAPISGFYYFNGAVLFTSTLNSHVGGALLAKNGSTLVEGNYGSGNASQAGFSVSRVLQLSANDTVALWQNNSSGGAVTVAGGSTDFTYFEGYLISAT